MKSLRLSLFLAALVAVCSAAPPPADGTIDLKVYDATAGVWRGKLIAPQNGKLLGPVGGVWGLQAGGGGGSSVWGGLSGNITDQTDLMTQLALRAALSGATFTGGVTAPGFTGPLTGNVTGNITGNAGTATALQTPRTINGVTFAGTANITVPAAAETLTGSALPALNGSALTNLSGSAIASGNINYARLGTSLATAGTFLSGTGTTPQWRSLAANDIILAQGLLGNVVSGGTAGGQVIPIMPPLGFSGGNMVLSYAAPLYLDGANLALAVTNGGNGVADSGKVLQLDGNGSAAINNLTAASVAATSLDVGISGATTGVVYLNDAASSYTVQLQPESGLTGYRPVIFPDEPSAPEWKVAYKWWVQNQGYLAAANNLNDVANGAVALANLAGEQNANLVYAGPASGGADNPSFRSVVIGDLPMADINNAITGNTGITTLGTITTGTWSATTIPPNKGGTGQTTYTNGQLLIGNTTGNTLTKATLTAGSGISITNGAGSITIAATGGSAGTKTIARLFPRDYEPPATNYAPVFARNGHPILLFDTNTQWAAVWTGIIPEGTDLSGGLTVTTTWSAATATTGTIGWSVKWERIASGGIDTDSDSFGTAQTITATTVSGTSGVCTQTSVTFSQAQLPASLAAGDGFRLWIGRDVASDNAAGNAELHFVEIKRP